MYHQILLSTIDDIQLMHVLDPEALRQVLESLLAWLHANSTGTYAGKLRQYATFRLHDMLCDVP